jgi:methyl-accepting chemotaxis protein
MTEHYNGDFNEIKNNINLCITTMNDLTGELNKLNDGVKKGKVDVRIDDNKFANVFKDIALGINLTVNTLTEPIYKLSEAISATASAANQISSSTEKMASGSNEQSSYINEVTAAMEEMTRTIFSTTKNTSFAAESSKHSAEKAKEGGKIVNEVITGMDNF